MLRRTALAATALSPPEPSAHRMHRRLDADPDEHRRARPRRHRRHPARARARQPRHPRTPRAPRSSRCSSTTSTRGSSRAPPSRTIVPALAEDYEVSEDGLTYTFTLSEGVTFHDGQQLTPKDVVTSLHAGEGRPDDRGTRRLRECRLDHRRRATTIMITLTEPNSTSCSPSPAAPDSSSRPATRPTCRPRRTAPAPSRSTSWKPGRQHHVRPQRRLLGRGGPRRRGRASTTSPTHRRRSTPPSTAASTC